MPLALQSADVGALLMLPVGMLWAIWKRPPPGVRHPQLHLPGGAAADAGDHSARHGIALVGGNHDRAAASPGIGIHLPGSDRAGFLQPAGSLEGQGIHPLPPQHEQERGHGNRRQDADHGHDHQLLHQGESLLRPFHTRHQLHQAETTGATLIIRCIGPLGAL